MYRIGRVSFTEERLYHYSEVVFGIISSGLYQLLQYFPISFCHRLYFFFSFTAVWIGCAVTQISEKRLTCYREVGRRCRMSVTVTMDTFPLSHLRNIIMRTETTNSDMLEQWHEKDYLTTKTNLQVRLTFYTPEAKITVFTNSVDPDEMALKSHLTLIFTVSILLFETLWVNTANVCSHAIRHIFSR